MYPPPPSHPADRPFALVVEQEFRAVLETRFFASRADCEAALDRELAALAVSDRRDTLFIYREGRLVSASWFDSWSDGFRQTGPWHGTPARDDSPVFAPADPSCGPFPF
ncbi:MAG: hypothetical protein OXE76_05305 [Alphaproteobacteria bacterium]|nr:hypothetical protein [Alphaproteobacteria bacterium]